MSRTPNFNMLAPIYRWMEWATFGTALWNCRCGHEERAERCRHALVLGGGDGRFTARMLEVNPALQVDAVDCSSAMLHALTKNAGRNAGRVRTFCADARQWMPEAEIYDLVVAQFFFDCFTTGEIAEMARHLRTACRPGAALCVSEFSIPRGAVRGALARGLIWGLYLAFNVLTGMRVWRLPDYRKALAQAGFRLAGESFSLGGLLVSELWECVGESVPGQRKEARTAAAAILQ